MFNNFLSLMLNATMMTIGLALCALLLGMVLSILFVVLETAKFKWLRGFTSVLLTLFRGLPEILVVFLIYYGSTQVLFMITGDYVEFGAFGCGVIALAIIFAAYASQSLRGAIQAAALGLTRAQAFIHVIMPQVWRHALPGLSNQWLVLLKDTALVSLIGVSDIMRQAELNNANTHQPFTWYGLAAILYLVITIVSKIGIRHLEQRFTRFEREGA